MTHAERSKLASTPCTAAHMTFGGRCMNCGFGESKVITYGTSYFVSRAMAVRYYRPYAAEDTPKSAVECVDRKLADGEIHIGKPPLKDGDTLTIIDEGTRYAITSQAATA